MTRRRGQGSQQSAEATLPPATLPHAAAAAATTMSPTAPPTQPSPLAPVPPTLVSSLPQPATTALSAQVPTSFDMIQSMQISERYFTRASPQRTGRHNDNTTRFTRFLFDNCSNSQTSLVQMP